MEAKYFNADEKIYIKITANGFNVDFIGYAFFDDFDNYEIGTYIQQVILIRQIV